MEIILASSSARRRELMPRVTPQFRTVPSTADEHGITERDPVAFAVAAAVLKARAAAALHPDAAVIGADTIVVLGDRILGKPRDLGEARAMLRALSGSTHRVITGIAICRHEPAKLLTDYEITRVTFKPLSDDDIDGYLAGNEVLDKAGSYAVQEVGDTFVAEMKGSFDNVVGFPVRRVKRLLERFLEPDLEVELTDVALPNDWAVARHEKMALFVPGGVLGDRVTVRIARRERRFSYAELVAVERPSPDRVEPPCPHFGTCGGCIFQNLRYERQLELKERYLRQTLRKLGGVDPESVAWLPVTPSPDTLFYRNKMEFAFGEGDGGPALGLRPRSSPLERYRRGIVPIDRCLIFSRCVETVFPVMLGFARESGLAAYDPRSHRGFLRHLVLREGKKTGALMAILVTADGNPGDLTRLAEGLLAAAPALRSLFWVVNTQVSDSVVYERKNHLWGGTWIEEEVGGLFLRVHPQTFLQPNTRAAEELYAGIVSFADLRGGERVLGCYCGAGAIELALARTAGEVIGIDASGVNIADAQANAARNRVGNCRFVEGTVEQALRGLPGSFDLVVVDPPRAGVSPRALERIGRFRAPRLLYVSCNPATLARDVKLLAEKGFRPVRAGGYDLFPHTAHLETVVMMERKPG